jgi:hypothetical protein
VYRYDIDAKVKTIVVSGEQTIIPWNSNDVIVSSASDGKVKLLGSDGVVQAVVSGQVKSYCLSAYKVDSLTFVFGTWEPDEWDGHTEIHLLDFAKGNLQRLFDSTYARQILSAERLK